MASVIDGEYTSMFLELFRYVLYIKDDKAKIQRFIIGLPTTHRDQIEFDEPRLIKEAVWKLKHFYEQSRCKAKPKRDLKGNL